MQGHFILCGLGRVGSRVLNYLRTTNGKIVVVDQDNVDIDEAGEEVAFVQGDCRRKEVLRRAGIDTARGVLILTSDDLVNLSTALQAHHLNPKVRIVVRMFNPSLLRRLMHANSNITALSTSALSAPILAIIACSGESLGAFSIRDEHKRQAVELAIRANSPLRKLQLADVTEQYPVLLVGHLPRKEGFRYLQQMDLSAQLESGDRIVLCGEPDVIARMRRQEHESAPDEPLWAGLVRRYARMLARVWAEIDLPVKIFMLALIGVVVFSTLILYMTVRNFTLAEGFARTIGIMATMADLRIHEMQLEDWQKIYVGMLRLSGAVLIAAFTALLTHYLVRAHLKGALEIRRIPEAGHVVVCGLGNVGYRVVEELLRDEENVVVIERDIHNPFIATVRRLGAAVIVGDATVNEVLKEAHANTACAVIVATSNDLVNVEVALMVREINSCERIILRLTDPNLAMTLRETSDIRLAVSIPDLAAPAFVASLFGDHVHSVFFVEGHLLAVVDLTVDDEESFLHSQSVRHLMEMYNFQVVSLLDTNQHAAENPLSLQLQVGDRLTVIVDLADLQRLLQQEKVAVPPSLPKARIETKETLATS